MYQLPPHARMSNAISTFRRLVTFATSLKSALITTLIHIGVFSHTNPTIPLCTRRVLFPSFSSTRYFRLFIQLQKVGELHIFELTHLVRQPSIFPF